MGNEIDQAMNVTAARGGVCAAVAVTATAYAYDLTALTFDGAGLVPNQADPVYVHLDADGADIYYVTSPLAPAAALTANPLNPATTIAANGTLAYANTSSGHIVGGMGGVDVRLDRIQDKSLVLVCASGKTSTLRIWASSQRVPSAGGL